MGTVVEDIKADTKARVAEVFYHEFPHSYWVRSPLPSQIGGLLIWDGFANHTPHVRQRLIWNAFEKRFSEQEMEEISGVMALTNQEYDTMLNDV